MKYLISYIPIIKNTGKSFKNSSIKLFDILIKNKFSSSSACQTTKKILLLGCINYKKYKTERSVHRACFWY